MEAPTGGPTGKGATQIYKEVISQRLPAAAATAKGFLIKHRNSPLNGLGQGQAVARPGFRLRRGFRLPGTMRSQEIKTRGNDCIRNVAPGQVVPAEGGCHQHLRIEPTRQGAERL